ncbi:transcriptional repressor [bacterium]|nr:transcriptional repressor [bacterium]RQV99328.1 MAG: transcriptional repressor [bacterium]
MNKETREKLLDAFYAKCRESRLSVTPQRLAIYKTLIGNKEHPSPEMIFKDVQSQFPMISFATVYKTLETFEQNGIVSKVTHLHNTLRYDPMTEQHHHIVCKRCKKIIDIDSTEIETLKIPSQVTKDHIFIDYDVHFNVICAECKMKE